MNNFKYTILLCLSVFMLGADLSAQDTLSTKADRKNPAGPGGNRAIGVNALPFINYAGNIFNNTSGNSLSLDTYYLIGKYYLSDDVALKAMLSVSDVNTTSRYYVRDDAAYFEDPLSQEKVVDEYTRHVYSYYLYGSMQKYIGAGKFKGFYGFTGMLGLSRDVRRYSYGNPITALNPTPTATYSYDAQGARLIYSDYGVNYTMAAGVLAGVEYFFSRNISIALDMTLMGSYSFSTQYDSKRERFDGAEVVVVNELNSPGGASFNIRTDLPYYGLDFFYHF